MNQNEIYVIGATRAIVGLSQILRISPGPNSIAGTIKILSGGTLEIIDPVYSGASSAPNVGWNQGYPLGTSEIYCYYGSSAFYLAATGATTIVAMTMGRTSGATLL